MDMQFLERPRPGFRTKAAGGAGLRGEPSVLVLVGCSSGARTQLVVPYDRK